MVDDGGGDDGRVDDAGGTGAARTQPALADKVAFLRRSDVYPEGQTRVDTVETHMAWVFLTAHHAYKLKKPVRYEFLDFSSLAARRRDCREELRLNRRLAPETYLGIVPLTREPDGELRLGGGGEPVEWLVHMKRLPGHRMLERAIRAGTVSDADIRRVAETLAAFHARSTRETPTAKDYAARLSAGIALNLRELSRPQFALPRADEIAAIARDQCRVLRESRARFEQRLQAGRIVEGHGDLRPEHICLTDPPVIIDCLEFRREFRVADTADELGFLALECERLGAAGVGRALLQAYRAASGDGLPGPVVNFYQSLRACIRARLSVWHLRDPDVRDPEHWRAKAREYLRLARRHIDLC